MVSGKYRVRDTRRINGTGKLKLISLTAWYTFTMPPSPSGVLRDSQAPVVYYELTAKKMRLLFRIKKMDCPILLSNVVVLCIAMVTFKAMVVNTRA